MASPTEENDPNSPRREELGSTEPESVESELEYSESESEESESSGPACHFCQDPESQDTKLVTLPCKHLSCPDCLRSLIQTAVSDRAYFPARCCYEAPRLPVEIFKNIVDGSVLLKTYEEMLFRSQYPPVYCSIPICSAFILPENILEGKATCPDCSSITCTECQQTLPGGVHSRPCEYDLATKEALAVMKLNKFRSCPKCKTATSLVSGCNSTICVMCGEEWCFGCGLSFEELETLDEHECEDPDYDSNDDFIHLPTLLPGQTRKEMIEKVLGEE